MLDAREILQDHASSPRGREPVTHPTHRGEGYNPLCGDRVEYLLEVRGERIVALGLQTTSCTICQASASMLCERAQGADVAEVKSLAAAFRAFLSDRSAPADPSLAELEALAGVRSYPVRVRCALLPWATLEQALEQPLGERDATPVRTEAD